ncbi:hypothetical protein [Anaeromyxobacter diazotrophicus]|uniref:Uncharacterized protein n=1 Tax=Anaeromyxobacter diazotrophicus TaxID=2590199 RepID=A0A7I9VQK8_9BACT|nr:hypothetical protein [Anaeromyxobacter diazotrophicus]GEJ58410.1 hypothetical protein AMYX_31510 [Anaeromyxobacter diazotrophicus]
MPMDDDAPRSRPTPIELERSATQELLALDRFVRAVYAELSGAGAGGGTPSSLLTEARLDLTGCRWRPPGVAAPGAGAGGAERRAAPARLTERARTVHLVADVAVVISTSDAVDGVDTWTVVHCMQLRRSSAGWALHELVSRDETYVFSEKVTDPRPLAARLAPPRRGRG